MGTPQKREAPERGIFHIHHPWFGDGLIRLRPAPHLFEPMPPIVIPNYFPEPFQGRRRNNTPSRAVAETGPGWFNDALRFHLDDQMGLAIDVLYHLLLRRGDVV
jgi:hypothetical protein